jgi:hypothetical protein
MTTSAQPNSSEVHATVASTKAADDGWGAWAELDVHHVADAPEAPNWATDLAGTRVKVFVPPPLVATVLEGKALRGTLTYRGAPGGGTFALTKTGA